jgi:hypothetical protein
MSDKSTYQLVQEFLRASVALRPEIDQIDHWEFLREAEKQAVMDHVLEYRTLGDVLAAVPEPKTVRMITYGVGWVYPDGQYIGAFRMEDHKVKAIQLFRTMMNEGIEYKDMRTCGLKEAKEFIEGTVGFEVPADKVSDVKRVFAGAYVV